MHQRGRLECVAPAIATKVPRGAFAKLVVHERQELFLSLRIPRRPRLEQPCHYPG
jgi:hypothetical protein